MSTNSSQPSRLNFAMPPAGLVPILIANTDSAALSQIADLSRVRLYTGYNQVFRASLRTLPRILAMKSRRNDTSLVCKSTRRRGRDASDVLRTWQSRRHIDMSLGLLFSVSHASLSCFRTTPGGQTRAEMLVDQYQSSLNLGPQTAGVSAV